jgi:hypothetical protein
MSGVDALCYRCGSEFESNRLAMGNEGLSATPWLGPTMLGTQWYYRSGTRLITISADGTRWRDEVPPDTGAAYKICYLILCCLFGFLPAGCVSPGNEFLGHSRAAYCPVVTCLTVETC